MAKYMLVFTLLIVGMNSLEFASDDDFCTIEGIVSDDGKNYQLPYRDDTEKFQVFYERIRDTEKIGYEIEEFYDGLKNTGVAVYHTAGTRYSMVANYDYNELVVISGDSCQVTPLNETIQETPFAIINVDGKPHLATPLSLISKNVSSKVAYLGSTNRFVRGIPVRQWRVCDDEQGADHLKHRITISYSDPDKWSPALRAPGYDSIPVHVEVVIRSDIFADNGDITDSYNMFDFRPGRYVRNEAYYVPTGVYCEGRHIKKPFPKIPKSFSMLAAKTTFRPDGGSVLNDIRYEYSDEKKLIRIDLFASGRDFAEFVDFETKTIYALTKNTGECSITPFDASLSPWSPFLEDQTPEYQYVGQRRVRGINTDLWIAPRSPSLWEWYFTADGWQVISSSQVSSSLQQVPVLFTSYESGYEESIMDVYSFHPDSVDLLAFDLTPCVKFQKKQARFTISGSKNLEIISENIHGFKEATLLALEKSTQIRLIRIGGIEVILDDKVYVLFNLFNKSESVPNAEPSLEESFSLLKSEFENKQFTITIRDKSNKQITIEPDWQSLMVLPGNFSRFDSTEVTKTLGAHGVISALIMLAGLVVGIIFGALISIFIQMRKKSDSESSLPQMMSISNPSLDID